MTFRTASTAKGANSDECWETTLDPSEVVALINKLWRSSSLMGVAIAVTISTDFAAAFQPKKNNTLSFRSTRNVKY